MNNFAEIFSITKNYKLWVFNISVVGTLNIVEISFIKPINFYPFYFLYKLEIKGVSLIIKMNFAFVS